MPPRHVLLVLVVCNAWAFNFVASAAALEHWPPFLFTILRFCLVAAVLLPLLHAPPRAQWPRLLAVGLVNGALHFTFFFFALATAADIASVAIVLQSYVPLSVLLARAFLAERFGATTGVSILAAFAGVLLVGLDPVVFTRIGSLAFALGAALCLALGTILMRRLEGLDPFSFQTWTALCSLPPLAAASLAFEQDQLALLASAPWQAWGGVVYSALAASILGHGLFFVLIRRHPVARVTPYLLLAPLLAVVYGVLLWGDRPGWRLLAGGALVLGGVLVISLRAEERTARRRRNT